MTTYLSELYTRERGHTTRLELSRKSGIDERTVQTVLSELSSSGVLQAKIQIRCPHCNTQHGIFERTGNIPEEQIHCFDCTNSFDQSNERCWEVIYSVEEDPDDFFRDRGVVLRHFVESAIECGPGFFNEEFDRISNIENPQKRGRQLDVFVGLLFAQLPNVRVRLNDETRSGEVDVYIDCLEAQDWLRGIVGSHTMIENKWLSDPVQTSDVSVFRQKSKDIHACEAVYFLSMSGYTRSGRTKVGALNKIKSFENPEMIDLWEEDLMSIIEDGDPEETLRDRFMQ